MGSSGINMNPMIALSSLLALASANPLKFPGQGGLSLTQRVPNPCSTLQGTACVFPFTYDGVEYYQCTYKNSPTPWCATKLDPNGTVIVNNWGDCANTQTSACPVEDLTKPPAPLSPGLPVSSPSGTRALCTTSVQMRLTLRSLTRRPGAPLRSPPGVNTLMARPLSAPTPAREPPPTLLPPPPPPLQQLQQQLLHQPPQPQLPPQQPPPQLLPLPPPPLLPQ